MVQGIISKALLTPKMLPDHKMGPCKDRHPTMLQKPEKEKEFKQRAALASLESLSKLSKLQKKKKNTKTQPRDEKSPLTLLGSSLHSLYCSESFL